MSTHSFELTDNEIRRLAELGGLAPSGGNIQPWQMLATNRSLELYLDAIRSTSFLDVERYASIFSLGSFAENVSIASEAMGLIYEFRFLGYEDIRSPLAQFDYSARKDVSTADTPPLYTAIQKRVTNRKLFDGTTIETDKVEALRTVVNERTDLCRLRDLSREHQKKTLARILGRADRIRFLNQELHEQMFAEIRWDREEAEKTRDGIDVATLELPPQVVQQMLALRSYETIRSSVPPQALESMAEPAIMGCSHFCCLSLAAPISPETLFAAGRVLQRMWLTATQVGLAVQPWTILPFFLLRTTLSPGTGFSEDEEREILELGQELAALFELQASEHALFLFRLSRAEQVTVRSLRLPWDAFTTIQR